MPEIEGSAAAAACRRVAALVRTATVESREEVARLAVQIARVAAPTAHEHVRAALVADLFREQGVAQIETDELGDVVARVPGKQASPPLLVAAHLDTVFPASTPLDVVRKNGRLHGPGVGDNSLGVAAVILLPTILARVGVVPAVDLLLTGNVGEEGLGDLRGMRSVMDRYPDVGAVIAVEGHNLGRVTHVAVGSRRLRVRVVGPGGHSWGDFGRPNAIHIAAEIIAELARLPTPTSPKSTLSVGTIEGGLSVNTIAPEATFVIDIRSVSESTLHRLVERAERIISRSRDGVRIEIDVIGDRPAGKTSPDDRIVQLAVDVLDSIGVAATGDASSTDANIPISRGIPAVCIGLTTGGNVHRVDEFVDVEPLGNGLTQLCALTLAAAEELAAGTIVSSTRW